MEWASRRRPPEDSGEAGAPGASGILSPSRPRRGPRRRFLRSEGLPRPQAEKYRPIGAEGQGGAGALRWAAGRPSRSSQLQPRGQPGDQFRKPGGLQPGPGGPRSGLPRHQRPRSSPAGAPGPHSPLLRQSGPVRPASLGPAPQRAASPGPRALAAYPREPGRGNFSRRAPRRLGRPSAERRARRRGPGLGAVPAPGSSVTARRRGGAAARPRPGRRPG